MENNNKTFNDILRFWYNPEKYSEGSPYYIDNISYDVDYDYYHGIEEYVDDQIDVLIVRPIVNGFFHRRTDNINNIWEFDYSF
jgi:hypothetical protein